MIQLILVLLALYLAQAAHLSREAEVVFRCDWRGRWRECSSGSPSGRRIYFGKLLPPLRGLMISRVAQAQTAAMLQQQKETLEQRYTWYEKHSHWTRALSDTLFLLFVVIAPLTITVFGFARTWLLLALELVLLQIASFAAFIRASKALYTESAGSRTGDSLTVLLSPIAALRTDDILLKRVSFGIHPVVVASVVLGERDARRYVQKFVLRAQNSGTQDIAAITEFSGFTNEIRETRQPRWAGSTHYCPLCEAEYDSSKDCCSDCQIPLVAFSGQTGRS